MKAIIKTYKYIDSFEADNIEFREFDECCEYGDKYAGDDAEQTAFNYIKYAAQKFYYGDENDEIL